MRPRLSTWSSCTNGGRRLPAYGQVRTQPLPVVRCASSSPSATARKPGWPNELLKSPTSRIGSPSPTAAPSRPAAPAARHATRRSGPAIGAAGCAVCTRRSTPSTVTTTSGWRLGEPPRSAGPRAAGSARAPSCPRSRRPPPHRPAAGSTSLAPSLVRPSSAAGVTSVSTRTSTAWKRDGVHELGRLRATHPEVGRHDGEVAGRVGRGVRDEGRHDERRRHRDGESHGKQHPPAPQQRRHAGEQQQADRDERRRRLEHDDGVCRRVEPAQRPHREQPERARRGSRRR